MLDSRFRLQRISHKHTLHLCKTTLTVCTPDLKAPDLHWTIGIFGNPDSIVFNFIESFIKWFADCSHCSQEIPFPTKKTCLHDMESLAENSSCRSNVLSTVASFALWSASDCCQLLLLATADQLGQYRQVPVLPSQTFRQL